MSEDSPFQIRLGNGKHSYPCQLIDSNPDRDKSVRVRINGSAMREELTGPAMIPRLRWHESAILFDPSWSPAKKWVGMVEMTSLQINTECQPPYMLDIWVRLEP